MNSTASVVQTVYRMRYAGNCPIPLLYEIITVMAGNSELMKIEMKKTVLIANSGNCFISVNLPEKYIIVHDDGSFEFSQGL